MCVGAILALTSSTRASGLQESISLHEKGWKNEIKDQSKEPDGEMGGSLLPVLLLCHALLAQYIHLACLQAVPLTNTSEVFPLLSLYLEHTGHYSY